MNKHADTEYPVHELIRTRWSPRAFADKDVSAETLRSLLEAARWAPSCFNDQPWAFVVARRSDDAAGFERLAACLTGKNQLWAPKAPVLLLAIARLKFAHNGKPNRHAQYDVGQAVATLLVEATARGLSLHQMAGFDVEKARETLSIPDDHEPMAMIALGYRGDPKTLPDELREREMAARSRRPQKEWVYEGKFEKA